MPVRREDDRLPLDPCEKWKSWQEMDTVAPSTDKLVPRLTVAPANRRILCPAHPSAVLPLWFRLLSAPGINLCVAMHDVDLLKSLAEDAFQGLLLTIEDVPEPQSWARAECRPGEYLHTEGSIFSIVVHLAGCKFLYGSAAYRDLDIRWRHTVDQMESFWPRWESAKAWLLESHQYWMDSWKDETDLERMVQTNWEELWPSWKVIWTMCHHDSYHAGQIQQLKATLAPSETPPPREAGAWQEFSSPYSW